MRSELQQWLDQVVGKPTKFSIGVIDRLWTQRYALAIDDLNPLYFDADYAAKHGYRGIIAPPNYLATLRGPQSFGPRDDELLGDGMSPAARPPLPNLLGLGGGQTIEIHAHTYCGEFIVGERTVTGASEKMARSGPLIIIEDEIDYRTDTDEPRVTLRNTLLCRWTDGGAG